MSVKLFLSNPFLTEAELSNLTNIPRKSLQRLRKEGGGPPWVRFGQRTIRYPKDQFQKWVEEYTQTQGDTEIIIK